MVKATLALLGWCHMEGAKDNAWTLFLGPRGYTYAVWRQVKWPERITQGRGKDLFVVGHVRPGQDRRLPETVRHQLNNLDELTDLATKITMEVRANES